MKRFINRIFFNAAMHFYMRKLYYSEKNSVIIFPVLVDAQLNKEKWFERYLNGTSVYQQFMDKGDEVANNIQRTFKNIRVRERTREYKYNRRMKIPKEELKLIYDRHHRFVEYHENMQEIRHYFPETAERVES